DSVFGIKYDGNTIVDDLRKVIWKEEIKVPEHVKAKDLLLYQVNINLNTQNPQRAALGNPDANIVTDLGGQKLRPIDNVENKFSAPANEHIHIIIEVPVVAEATLETTEGEPSYKRAIEQIANILDRQMPSTKYFFLSFFKKPRISLSNTIVFTMNSTNKNFDEQFVWDDRAENQHMEDQKDSLALVWYDSKSKKDLLSVYDVSLPYRISGTADVLVMDEKFYNVLDYHSGIRAGFELKKTVQDYDVNQAIAKLIVANIHSNYAVFLVLTDLNNSWMFYWLSNNRTIMMFRAANSSNALDIIERALTEDPTSITIDPNFPIGARINCFHHLRNL
ncbi:4790_t:CDS:2, partial [Dentiscutata erythropus]